MADSILDTVEATKHTVDAAVASAATKAMGGGTVAAVVGWVSSSEGIATLGFLLTIAGFIVNLIFQFRRDKREQRLLALQTAKLEAETAEAKHNDPLDPSNPNHGPINSETRPDLEAAKIRHSQGLPPEGT